MAFDSLTEKLQNVFRNLRSKGRLTEDDVKAALKEVKMALLEADVNFKVVKGFIKDVQERAIGQDVMNGLNPGQMVIKIVNEELIRLMGSETTEIKLQPGSAMTVIMMAGLQGAGKTTTTAKLAGKFKLKGKKLIISFTTGAPEEAYTKEGRMGYTIEEFLNPIKATCKQCQMVYYGAVKTYGVSYQIRQEKSKEIKEKALKHAKELAKMLKEIKND